MPEITPSRYLTTAGWGDCPHLPIEEQVKILSSYPLHQRKARSKGEPSLGVGAIWPVPPEEFEENPFPIPDHWPRVYALDVGWKKTAAIWGALDRQVDTWHFYSEYYRSFAEPSVHVAAIKARGDWIPGIIDPASAGASQRDGRRLNLEYSNLGLNLKNADNDVEAGILAVFDRLTTGRLRVFKTLQNWFKEQAIYRRDEKGKIVKAYDHLCDCSRYLILSGTPIAICRPAKFVMATSMPPADQIAGY